MNIMEQNRQSYESWLEEKMRQDLADREAAAFIGRSINAYIGGPISISAPSLPELKLRDLAAAAKELVESYKFSEDAHGTLATPLVYLERTKWADVPNDPNEALIKLWRAVEAYFGACCVPLGGPEPPSDPFPKAPEPKKKEEFPHWAMCRSQLLP